MLLAALVAVGLVAVIVVIRASPPRSSGGEGPLVALLGGQIGIGQPTAVGKAMSVSGPLFVKNTSDNAVVLDRVELVGIQNVTYVGAYAVPFPLHESPFTADFTYRVPPYGRVLPGVTVAPHATAWIVVGLTPKRGRHQWTEMDLIYHDGGVTYRRHAAVAGAVCAPFNKYLGHCHAPGLETR
ncbi:MAG TPA: hypothetical protein VMU72_00065 [Gaiellaceae bacterium]|nr:hypothetical protein [Gaiellaceae bacterium]